MPEPFGAFGWICRHAPLPQCNLFFNQLWNRDSLFLTVLFPSNSDFFSDYSVTGTSARDDPAVQIARADAGTGLGANCEIPHVGHRGSPGDAALVVLSALSLIMALGLWWHAGRRHAAVGRVELRILLLFYALHSGFQIVTMSSFLEQGSTALAVLSSIHVSVIVAGFWVLLGNAIVATQLVEDGTPAAIVPLLVFAVLFFIPPLYISLDVSLSWTNAFDLGGNVQNLRSTALFVLTLLWPAFAALAYGLMMLYVVVRKLGETRPAVYYVLGGLLFAGGQVIFFLASQPLCDASNEKINGAFLTTLLNSAAILAIYQAWKSITEEDWGEDYGQY